VNYELETLWKETVIASFGVLPCPEENYEWSQSGYSVSRPRFERSASRIHVRSVTARADLLGLYWWDTPLVVRRSGVWFVTQLCPSLCVHHTKYIRKTIMLFPPQMFSRPPSWNCHVLSDRRRGLDWHLDLLESNTQLHTVTAESLRTLPLLTLQPSSVLRTLYLLCSRNPCSLHCPRYITFGRTVEKTLLLALLVV
jgi:hypothetical protein